MLNTYCIEMYRILNMINGYRILSHKLDRFFNRICVKMAKYGDLRLGGHVDWDICSKYLFTDCKAC